MRRAYESLFQIWVRLSQLKNKYYQNLLVQLVGIPIPALILSVILIKWNFPIYELWDIPKQIPIFGGISLFAIVLLIYALDFLVDIKYWETKNIGHFAVFKLLAKIWIAVSLSIILSTIGYLIFSGQAKELLVGNQTYGFLNPMVGIIVVLIGMYVLLKISKKQISGLFFIVIIALVTSMSVTLPTFMVSNMEKFRLQADLYDPILGFFAIFMMNLLTVSFFEREKDLVGNTQNIWNTNEKMAQSLIYSIPVLSMLGYWFFKWNAGMHALFFVMFFYLLMYYIPSVFRKASAYRILADAALLLMFVKIKW